MANSITHAALPPIRKARYTMAMGFRDASGAATAPTSLDTEVSLDGGTFADASNEVTLIKEVGGATDSAMGYVSLTATEMDASVVTVQIKSSNCLTELITIYPMFPVYLTGNNIAQDGAAESITIQADESSIDDYYVGMILKTNTGTGGNQARLITDYDGTTKVVTVTPAWETAPTTGTTYSIGLYPTDKSVVAIQAGLAAAAADAVWDEVAADHVAAGTFGDRLYRLWCRLCGKKYLTDAGDKTIISYAEDGSTPVDTWTQSTDGDQTIYTRT